MGTENTVDIVVKGNSKDLEQSLGRGERALRSFAGKSRRMLKGLRGGLNRTLTSLPAQLGFVGVAAGLGIAAKGVVDFEAKLTQFAIQSKISRKEQASLREEILRTAFATGQTQDKILEGMDAIVQRTGDYKGAKESILGIGFAATASGAQTEQLGALTSQLSQKFKLVGKDAFEALDILTSQGKEGAFTLENLASLGERLFASAGRLDMSGIEDLRRVGAFAQIARMGTGSSESATTSVERVLSNILAKQKQISKLGFDIRDEGGSIKELDTILKGIIISTKGDEAVLGKLFGEEGIRSISILAKMYRDTNKFDLFDKLIQSKGGELMKDFARNSETAAFQLTRLGVVGTKFADAAFAEPIKELSLWIGELGKDQDKIDEIAEKFKSLGSVIVDVAKGAAWFFEAIGKGISGTADFFGGIEQFHVQDEIKRKMGISGVGDTSAFFRENLRNRNLANQTTAQNQDVSLNNKINVTVNVDKEGKLKSASVINKNQPGVKSSTFLNEVFTRGSR